jgi:septum formation protein
MWLMERMIHPIIEPMRLILASASPRRAELLRAAGFDFEVRVVEVDERVRPGERPEEYVCRLAIEKASKVPSGAIVLGADTAVVVEQAILGKPANDEEAAAMLRRLSGRTHEVLTGISVRANSSEIHRVERTTVEFAPLSDAEIAWYVGSGEGRDKAGGYAIQGLASRFIPRIDGSYSNVVGLPIATVRALLAEIASRA